MTQQQSVFGQHATQLCMVASATLASSTFFTHLPFLSARAARPAEILQKCVQRPNATMSLVKQCQTCQADGSKKAVGVNLIQKLCLPTACIKTHPIHNKENASAMQVIRSLHSYCHSAMELRNNATNFLSLLHVKVNDVLRVQAHTTYLQD